MVSIQFKTSDPRVHAGGGGGGGGGGCSKSSIYPKDRIFALKFLEVHILKTTCQKAFILAPKIPCRVSIHSTTSDPRVHAKGVWLEFKI